MIIREKDRRERERRKEREGRSDKVGSVCVGKGRGERREKRGSGLLHF